MIDIGGTEVVSNASDQMGLFNRRRRRCKHTNLVSLSTLEFFGSVRKSFIPVGLPPLTVDFHLRSTQSVSTIDGLIAESISIR